MKTFKVGQLTFFRASIWFAFLKMLPIQFKFLVESKYTQTFQYYQVIDKKVRIKIIMRYKVSRKGIYNDTLNTRKVLLQVRRKNIVTIKS